eukprot:m.308345 g.308345  ORF g.308345 m.308345 type:complete len:197 (+) comp43807_c0_seq1:102-692(+)
MADKFPQKQFSGGIYKISEAGQSTLANLLKTIDDVRRKIAITINNESGFELKPAKVWFQSGTSDLVLPEKIGNGMGLAYTARKTKSAPATGAVGVMAFDFTRDKEESTLAILFSVTIASRNKWNAKVYPEKARANSKMYEELCKESRDSDSSPAKGDGCWHRKELLRGQLYIKGIMDNSSKGKLNIFLRSCEDFCT